MTTRIGLISDVHATPAPLQEAVSIFAREGVDHILCAGDIAGYGEYLDDTVELLKACDCRTILGNHDAWYLEDLPDTAGDESGRYLQQLPPIVTLDVENRTLYMVHASPPRSDSRGMKLLDEHGAIMPDQVQMWTDELHGFGHDILVVGHTHQVFAEHLGETLVINPGSTKFNHTCAVLSLPDMVIELFALSGKTPLKSWNWGVNRPAAKHPVQR